MKCVNFEHFDATRQIRLPAFHDARAARRALDLSHIATFEQSNYDIQIEASTDFNNGPQSLMNRIVLRGAERSLRCAMHGARLRMPTQCERPPPVNATGGAS